MDRILTAKEIGDADARAFSEGKLNSRAVMEVAGRQVTDVLLTNLSEEIEFGVVVLCGPGNNGGDGYVLARALHQCSVAVEVFSVADPEQSGGDCADAALAYRAAGGLFHQLKNDDFSSLVEAVGRAGVLVDALFGTGVSGPLRLPYSELVKAVNLACLDSDTAVLSIDIPSGLDASSSQLPQDYLVADICVSLQSLKIAHVQLPASQACGEIFCVDIGICLDELPQRYLISNDMICHLSDSVLHFDDACHKGDRGHVQVLGGSPGYFGAPQLAAQAAGGCGAGIVELLLPDAVARKVSAHANEFLCNAVGSDERGVFVAQAVSGLPTLLSKANSLVIGPGMGVGDGALRVLESALDYIHANGKRPVVIDADALTLVAGNPRLKNVLGEHVLLTPHPGEMGRLLDCSTEEVQLDRLSAAKRCAEKYSSWVLLKGAYSILHSPDEQVFVNPFANASLAVAGSGDVLAGCLGGLACREADWGISGVVGMFAHGLAGEILSEDVEGIFGASAPRLISTLPEVLQYLSELNLEPVSFVRHCLPFGLGLSLVNEDQN